MRLRVLWVTPDLPRSGVSAARAYWWALLARVARRHDVVLLAFVRPEDVDRTDLLPPGLAGFHAVPRRDYAPDDPLALLPRTVAGGHADPRFRDAIAERLGAERFDLVQYEFTEMAHLRPPSPVPALLTVHQIGFASEAAHWRADGRRLGHGLVFLHRYLRELDFELRAVAAADHVATVSPEDAARLRRFLPDLAVSVSPVGVDCDVFRPQTSAAAPGNQLVFVGNFGHPPNADAVRFLLREVLPALERPHVLRIIGQDMPPEVIALARPGTVEVLGPVDDVRPHLAAASAVLAPVRFGTGMRGKVLEALAMARPVVATSLGAEGLGATPGHELLVADDAGTFVRVLRNLLDHPALGVRLGTAGRALVTARFDWDVVAAGHEAIYERTLHAARRDGGVAQPERPPRLPRGLRGWPAIAAGAALLGSRAVRWHLRRLRAARTVPSLAASPLEMRP